MKACLIIGWREWVALPDLGIGAIKAKIDTGAATSALHAYKIRIEENSEGTVAHFCVHPRIRRRRPEILCSAPVHDIRTVRSSNGHSEQRIVVKTGLTLGPYTRPILLTLTNRDEMTFRMLIGREALRDRYVVNSAHSYSLNHEDLDNG